MSMFKPTRRRSRRMNVVPVLVLVAAGAAWAGANPLAAGAVEAPPMCFDRPATIVGTPGDDVLSGTSGDDVIVGLEGTDEITSSGGEDRVCAGPNDLSVDADGVPRYERVTVENGYVDGGPGLDRIEMGFGARVIISRSNPTVVDDQGRRWPERILVDNADSVQIHGGDGPDQVDVGLAAETGQAYIDAGAGHDVVLCFGDDQGESCDLRGGRGIGNDRLRAIGASQALVLGASGNDVLSAVEGDLELDGGPGNDALFTRDAESETLRGQDGADRLVADSFVLSLGPHILQGGAGDDYLEGHEVSERFGGGAGTDVVHAGGGNDTAWGGTGADRLGGASGRDHLFGESGNDANFGGPGSDLCRSPQSGPRAPSCER